MNPRGILSLAWVIAGLAACTSSAAPNSSRSGYKGPWGQSGAHAGPGHIPHPADSPGHPGTSTHWVIFVAATAAVVLVALAIGFLRPRP